MPRFMSILTCKERSPSGYSHSSGLLNFFLPSDSWRCRLPLPCGSLPRAEEEVRGAHRSASWKAGRSWPQSGWPCVIIWGLVQLDRWLLQSSKCCESLWNILIQRRNKSKKQGQCRACVCGTLCFVAADVVSGENFHQLLLLRNSLALVRCMEKCMRYVNKVAYIFTVRYQSNVRKPTRMHHWFKKSNATSSTCLSTISPLCIHMVFLVGCFEPNSRWLKVTGSALLHAQQ